MSSSPVVLLLLAVFSAALLSQSVGGAQLSSSSSAPSALSSSSLYSLPALSSSSPYPLGSSTGVSVQSNGTASNALNYTADQCRGSFNNVVAPLCGLPANNFTSTAAFCSLTCAAVYANWSNSCLGPQSPLFPTNWTAVVNSSAFSDLSRFYGSCQTCAPPQYAPLLSVCGVVQTGRLPQLSASASTAGSADLLLSLSFPTSCPANCSAQDSLLEAFWSACIAPYPAVPTAASNFRVACSPVSPPLALTAMTFFVLSSTSVSITWSEPSALHAAADAPTFVLLRYGPITSSSTPATLNISVNTSTAYVDYGLSSGSTYGYSIVATDSAGSSAPSMTFFVSTPVAPPQAPNATFVTVNSATSATVSWTAVSPVDSSGVVYVVSRQSASSAFPLAPVYRGPALNFTFFDLQYNTTYNVAVTAVSPNAGAGPAALNNFTTPAAVPSAPIAFFAVNVSVSAFVLQWSAPLVTGAWSIASYYVQWQTAPGVWSAPFIATAPQVTSAALGVTVSPFTVYTFRVNATNSGGRTGPFSALFAFTTPANVPSQLLPIVPTVSPTLGNSVFLQWNASINNGGSPLILLHLSIASTQTSDVREVDVPAASQSYLLSNLLYSTPYTATWRALNAYGWSQTAAVATFTTKRAAPVIVALRAGDSCACRTAFGAQSTITALFSVQTSQPSISSQAGVDALFSFTPSLPGSYSGAWILNGSAAVITFSSVASSSLLSIGLVSATVLSNLTDASATSASAIGAVSPPLSGTWYGAVRSVSYFNSTQPVFSVKEDSQLNPIQLVQGNGLYSQSTAQLTLSVLYGSLSLSTPLVAASLYNAQLNSSSSSSAQLNVSVPYTSLRAFLNSPLLTYTPRALSTATDVLSVGVQDSLAGGYVSDSVVVPILISQVNHAPTIVLPAQSSVKALVFGSAYTLPVFSVQDADTSYAPSWAVSVTIRVQQSTTALLALSSSATAASTLSLSSQAGVWVSTLTLAGPIADLNAFFQQSPVNFTDAGMIPSISRASVLIYVNDSANGGQPAMTSQSSLVVPVTCNGTAAPSVLSAQLSNDLGSILLTFDSPLDQSAALSVDCGLFFTAATVAQFGLSSSCSYRGGNGLAIVLGYGATVLPTSTLTLLSVPALRRCLGGQATSVSPVVSSPTVAIVPVVSISGPVLLSSCDPLTLYGQATGLGGRVAASYSWTVSKGSTNASSSAVDATAQIIGSGGSSATLVLQGSQLYAPNAFYFFYLTVSNFLGQSNTSGFVVFKSSLALPLLIPQGSTQVTSSASSSFYLAVTPSLSSCLTGNDKVMNFSWSVTPAPLTTLAMTNPQINVPSYALSSGQYAFTLTGVMATNAALTSSVTISVTVPPSPITASIGGGAVQQFSQLYDFSLQAAGVDPDVATQTPSAFHWMWACQTTAGLACFDNVQGSVLAVSSVGVQTIRSGQLSAGAYVFTAVATNGPRTASATVTVSVVANPLPLISIASFLTVVNPNSVLFYSASVSDVTNSPLRFLWTQVSGPALALSTVAASTTGPQLVLNNARAAIFTAGASYTFQCQVTNGFNQSNYGQVSVTINAPPFGGTVTVSPSSGYAFNTSFTLQALGWQSSGGSALIYQFFAKASDGSLTQLSQSSGQAVAVVQLAQGTSSAVTVQVMVSDALSASTLSTAQVTVQPPPGLATDTTGAVFSNILSAATTTLTQTSNVGSTLSIISALTDSIAQSLRASQGGSSGSRRLLASQAVIPKAALQALTYTAQQVVANSVLVGDMGTVSGAGLRGFGTLGLVTNQLVQGPGAVLLAGLTASSRLIAVNSDFGRQQAQQATSNLITLTMREVAALATNGLQSNTFGTSRRLLQTSNSSSTQSSVLSMLSNLSSLCDSYTLNGNLAVAGQSIPVQDTTASVDVFRSNLNDVLTFSFSAVDNSTATFPASSLATALSNGAAASQLVDSRLWLFSINPFVWASPYSAPITSVLYMARVNNTATPLTLPSASAQVVTAVLTLPFSTANCSLLTCAPQCLQWDLTQSMWTNASGAISSSTPYFSATGQWVVDCSVAGLLQAYVAAFPLNRTQSSSSFASSSSVRGSSGSSLSSSMSSSSLSPVQSSTSVYAQTAFPAGSLQVGFYIVVPTVIGNLTVFLLNLTADIAFNLATELSVDPVQLQRYVVITSFNGTLLVSSHSRRLLAAPTQTPVVFVLLGSVQSALNVVPSSAVTAFSQAASSGHLASPNSGALIPNQTVLVTNPNAQQSSSSGVGYVPPTESTSDNLPLALGLGLGIGIPVIVALAALFWHFCVKGSAPVASTAMLHTRLPANSASQ